MTAPADPPSGDQAPGSQPPDVNGRHDPTPHKHLVAAARTLTEADQTSADADQTSADTDQTSADTDQTSADNDQASADCDQVAADDDQAASDQDLASGVDPRVHEHSRDIRERSTRRRESTTASRVSEADRRDEIARARDLAAAERDRAAEARDRLMRELDAANADAGLPRRGADVLLRAADQRKQAREHRAVAAAHREQAAHDRAAAAEDRREAAAERARSLADREALMHEIVLASTDVLTGARTRAAGLEDLERELNRTRRMATGLVVAYVDVIGLKLRNDTHGHAAGDALLRRVVTTMRTHLRPYDLLIRLGGDEFLCVLSGATLPNVHRRFDHVSAALAAGEDPAAVTAGFAELQPGETVSELIARADRDLIEHRRVIPGERGTQPADGGG